MQGTKRGTPTLFYQFTLSNLVPAYHIYRRIEQNLNMGFLHKQTADLYGSEV